MEMSNGNYLGDTEKLWHGDVGGENCKVFVI